MITGRRFRTIYTITPLNYIKIYLENPSLAQILLQRARDKCLFNFAQRILGFGEVEIFGKLLADGGSAASKAALLPVFFNSFLYLFFIEALMAEEIGIFARKHGAHQIGRDPFNRHPRLL